MMATAQVACSVSVTHAMESGTQGAANFQPKAKAASRWVFIHLKAFQSHFEADETHKLICSRRQLCLKGQKKSRGS